MVESPTAPRFQLAQELKALRNRAGLTANQAARLLRCAPETIRRYERGETTIRYADLLMLMNAYNVRREDDRALLDELREQADQPVWWSKYRLPDTMTRLLGFEAIAQRIQMFDLAVVPGLLQTADYCRAIIAAIELEASDEQIERWTQLRLERQQRIGDARTKPALSVLIGEPAIRCPVGGTAVLREQLEYLLDNPFAFDLRILPLNVGGHPGGLGSFYVFEFPPKLRKPAVYVEGPVRSLYLDEPEAARRATANFDRMWDLALDPDASHKLISTVIEELQS
ncbi:MAG TPA: helix-turn-helix transcriptional regulator [Actinopolymorphaceae bacterium]